MLQLENRSHRSRIIEQVQSETQLFKNGLHDDVVSQHLGDDLVEFLVSRRLNESPQQLGSQPASLVLV